MRGSVGVQALRDGEKKGGREEGSGGDGRSERAEGAKGRDPGVGGRAQCIKGRKWHSLHHEPTNHLQYQR